jgi:uncharacterized membrane protein YfcA
MATDKKPKQGRTLMPKPALFGGGIGVGAISALVSIGGGSLTIPFLMWQNVDMKRAIASSAAIGFPLSIAGTLGYMVNGMLHPINEPLTVGFVYLPAVFLISIVSYFTAPFGASVAHKLPISKLRKIFAVLLLILSVKMFTSL